MKKRKKKKSEEKNKNESKRMIRKGIEMKNRKQINQIIGKEN